MTIKTTSVNGLNVESAEKEMENLLDEYNKTGDVEIEKKMIVLHRKMNGNKPKNCSLCAAGRKRFVLGLRQIKEGKTTEAMESINASMKSAKIKWKILTE